MSETLNDYIEKLRPVQQDLIVACVREYCTGREGLHRGILPFLPAQEAAIALRIRLECLKRSLPYDGSDVSPTLGEKLIKQTMSIFSDALQHRIAEDEISTKLQLDSVKLRKHYRSRMRQKFTVFWKSTSEQIELRMINKTTWRVTASRKIFEEVTLYLVENFR